MLKNTILATVVLITACSQEPVIAENPTVKRCLQKQSLEKLATISAFGDEDYTCVMLAQSMQESSCKSTAKSPAGAYGRKQFTIPTILWASKTFCRSLGVVRTKAKARKIAQDDSWSIRCGAKYVAHLQRIGIKHGVIGDRETLGFALDGYNGGVGNTVKELKLARKKGLATTKYFGSVSQTCVRANWACKESKGIPPKWRGYSHRILNENTPLFRDAGVSCNLD